MPTSARSHRDYWDSFYAGRASRKVPDEPSAFARWVHGRLRPGQPIIELGFGTGRDSLWFARQGHPVTGFDFAPHAVDRAQGLADGRDVAARFAMLDLYERAEIERVAAELRSTTDHPALYARFLLHSLEDDGRLNLLDLAARVLDPGGELYLEFRTGKDKGERHVFGDDHFRLYLDPEIVVGEIVERSGAVVLEESGHGLAVYDTEDPHVARIVARWTP